jgi:hypothetical protein
VFSLQGAAATGCSAMRGPLIQVSPQAQPPRLFGDARIPIEPIPGVLPAFVVSGALRRPDGCGPGLFVVKDWGRLYKDAADRALVVCLNAADRGVGDAHML